MNQMHRNRIYLGIVLPLIGWMALAIAVTKNPTLLQWDTSLLLRLHQYAVSDFNRDLAIVVTRLGTTWGVLPASVLLISVGMWRQRWQAATYFAVVMLGSTLLNAITKLVWHRVRPNLWEGIPPHADFSFPSGHATYSMAFVLALIILAWDSPKRPWLIVWGALFTLTIGFTRLYLGVHYLTDILGGWLLAIVWSTGMSLVILKR